MSRWNAERARRRRSAVERLREGARPAEPEEAVGLEGPLQLDLTVAARTRSFTNDAQGFPERAHHEHRELGGPCAGSGNAKKVGASDLDILRPRIAVDVSMDESTEVFARAARFERATVAFDPTLNCTKDSSELGSVGNRGHGSVEVEA